MRYSAIVAAGFAAVAQATWDGKFTYPPGIEPLGVLSGNADFSIKTFGPSEGPSDDCISVWHPPHPNVYIDDCDSDKDNKWHWVHPGKRDSDNSGKDKDNKPKVHDKPNKNINSPIDDVDQPDEPQQPTQPTTAPPEWKWTTSTVTQTAVSTMFSCASSVTNCPVNSNGGGNQVKTVTVPAVVTICPVQVNPVPATPVPAAPPASTKPAVQPAPNNPALPSSVIMAPVATPPPPPVAPPVTPTRPVEVGTGTRPNATTPTSRLPVTAAAVPNAQRAGGVFFAVAAAAAVFV